MWLHFSSISSLTHPGMAASSSVHINSLIEVTGDLIAKPRDHADG